jgi:hypothetical protein
MNTIDEELIDLKRRLQELSPLVERDFPSEVDFYVDEIRMKSLPEYLAVKKKINFLEWSQKSFEEKLFERLQAIGLTEKFLNEKPTNEEVLKYEKSYLQLLELLKNTSKNLIIKDEMKGLFEQFYNFLDMGAFIGIDWKKTK